MNGQFSKKKLRNECAIIGYFKQICWTLYAKAYNIEQCVELIIFFNKRGNLRNLEDVLELFS